MNCSLLFYEICNDSWILLLKNFPWYCLVSITIGWSKYTMYTSLQMLTVTSAACTLRLNLLTLDAMVFSFVTGGIMYGVLDPRKMLEAWKTNSMKSKRASLHWPNDRVDLDYSIYLPLSISNRCALDEFQVRKVLVQVLNAWFYLLAFHCEHQWKRCSPMTSSLNSQWELCSPSSRPGSRS